MNQSTSDMSENQLVALALKTGTIAVCVLIAVTAGCEMHADYQATQAIIKGVDPVATACALGSNEDSVCAIAAARSERIKNSTQ
jgi:hypothetical protein